MISATIPHTDRSLATTGARTPPVHAVLSPAERHAALLRPAETVAEWKAKAEAAERRVRELEAESIALRAKLTGNRTRQRLSA